MKPLLIILLNTPSECNASFFLVFLKIPIVVNEVNSITPTMAKVITCVCVHALHQTTRPNPVMYNSNRDVQPCGMEQKTIQIANEVAFIHIHK